MGFYDEVDKVKKKNIDERMDSKDVLLESIDIQIKVNDDSIHPENKPKTKDKKTVRSWFVRNQCTPVVRGLNFLSGDEISWTVPDKFKTRTEFLEFLKSGVENGDLDSDISDYDKRRVDRDKRVTGDLNKNK